MGTRKYTDEDLAVLKQASFLACVRGMAVASTDTLEEGRAWYTVAHAVAKELRNPASNTYGRPVTTGETAAVIAVTSPRVLWASNVETATNLCHGRNEGAGTDANRAKGLRILAGDEPWDEVVSGLKVTPFQCNIHNPRLTWCGCTTLDTRMQDAFNSVLGDADFVRRHAGGRLYVITDADLFGKPYVYEALSQGVRKAAESATKVWGEPWLPLQVQAVTWLVVGEQPKFAVLNSIGQDVRDLPAPM